MWLLLSLEASVLFPLHVTQFLSRKKAAAILKDPPHTHPGKLHLSLSPLTVQKTEMQLDSCSVFFHITFCGINFCLRETTERHSVVCDACKWGVLRSSCLRPVKRKWLHLGDCSQLILAYHLFHNLLYCNSLPDTCSVFNNSVLRVFRNVLAAAYRFSNTV